VRKLETLLGEEQSGRRGEVEVEDGRTSSGLSVSQPTKDLGKRYGRGCAVR
jgi:hypothetical protein